MPAPRHDVVRTHLCHALQASALLVGCTFNAVGLGPTGDGSQGSTGGSTGLLATDTGTEPTGPTGPGSTDVSTSAPTDGGEAGTSGAVDPGTSTSTGELTTATTTEPGTTGTTGTATSSTTDTSSGGCVETDYYLDADLDGAGDPNQPMPFCDLTPPTGYAAEGNDCNDGDPAMTPGGDEVCDQKDNDCDGLEDEFSPTNNDCEGCKMVYFEPHLYHFCATQEKWPDARTRCEERGAALAIDDDMEEHDWLVSQLPDESGGWYIGASAPDKDDKFVWLDGTPVPNPDARWGTNRPFGSGGTDFLALVSGGFNLGSLALSSKRWHDRGMNDQEPYICEGPLPP